MAQWHCFIVNPILSSFVSIGILASAFSSMDSAMTSITTSLSVDFVGVKRVTKNRRILIHFLVALLFLFIMWLTSLFKNSNAIDLIYTLVSYLYGPLLGLFTFGMLTSREVRPFAIPIATVLGPILSYLLFLVFKGVGYIMGYELLLLNGFLVCLFLFIGSKKK